MPRLSAAQWEKARAEYEVRGISLKEVARRFGVSDMAVGNKARKEGWVQGKNLPLVEKKIAIIKANAEFEQETLPMPQTFRHTIETVARERLQADGYLASFDVALAMKGMELANKISSAEDFELLSRGRRHLSGQTPKESPTTVNINQQQAQISASPRDILSELVRNAIEE